MIDDVSIFCLSMSLFNNSDNRGSLLARELLAQERFTSTSKPASPLTHPMKNLLRLDSRVHMKYSRRQLRQVKDNHRLILINR